MSRLRRLQLLVFTENLASAVVGVGSFYYTVNGLGYSDRQNLLLGLGTGTFFVIGALLSHPLATLLGERRILALNLFITTLLHLLLGFIPGSWFLPAAVILLHGLYGMKWPVMESYVTAGLTPVQTNKALGWFNIVWSSTTPMSLFIAGPIIAWWVPGLYWFPMAVNLLSIALLFTLESRLEHLPHDHPERPDESALDRMRLLLHSSRWGMVLAFAMVAILNPLLPGIFERLGEPVQRATALGAMMYVSRVVMFALLGYWSGWHGRRDILAWMLALLPITFFFAILGHDVVSVTVATICFGVLMSVAYSCGLYYAMVVKNAAVDAGGHHEAIIGSGFLGGPVSALAGTWAGTILGGTFAGLCAVIGPVSLVLVALGVRPLVKMSAPKPEPQSASIG